MPKKESTTKKEINKLSDIKMLTETTGGKQLIGATKELCVNTLIQITNGYKTLSHPELISLCAKLEANYSMYQLLTGIKKQIKGVEELYKYEEEE